MWRLLISVALLAGAVTLYLCWTTLQLHTLHPWPVYFLLAVSLGIALSSRAPRSRKLPVVGLSLLFALAFVGYMESFSMTGKPELAIGIGDPFPDFTLTTSRGDTFSSDSLRGKSRALYLFYRGDW